MKSLWLEDGKLELRENIEAPRPAPGEALIEVSMAGICSTDLELQRGYYPFTGIPGHEFVGEVVKADSAPDWVGRRVVGEINASCGTCSTCLAGRPTHCPERSVLGIVGLNGVFAERIVLPVGNLHPLPDAINDDVAVFCEPLAAALEITEQVHIGPRDRVLLVGAGRLGQLIARVLKLTGCALAVVVRHPRHRELLEVEGIETIEPDELAARRACFDVVVEASGSPGGFALAREALRPRGMLVLKSTYAGKLELDASALVVDEISVVGSRCGPFAPALRLLEGGFIDVKPLIESIYPLEQAVAAFEHAARPAALKVLISMHRSC